MRFKIKVERVTRETTEVTMDVPEYLLNTWTHADIEKHAIAHANFTFGDCVQTHRADILERINLPDQ